MKSTKKIRKDRIICAYCQAVLFDKTTEVEVKEGDVYTSYTLTAKECDACKVNRSLGIK